METYCPVTLLKLQADFFWSVTGPHHDALWCLAQEPLSSTYELSR
jgi:hypothetical protein